MDKYPELTTMMKDGAQAIAIDGEGKLTIAEWAIKDLTLMINEKVGVAKVAANLGEQKVREKEIDELERERDNLAKKKVSDIDD
jgi:hypothetical protein